jgi:hypothetical protein
MSILAQLTDTQVSTRIQESDLGFLMSNGYITRISRQDHDRAAAEIANMDQTIANLHQEEEQEERDAETLIHDEKHEYGFRSHFEGRAKKEAEREKVAKEEELVDQEKICTRHAGAIWKRVPITHQPWSKHASRPHY